MRTSRVAAGIAALLLLSGCASTGAQLDQATDDARAAVGGAALALKVAPGITPPGVLSTALDDALREVVDATTTVLELQPEGAEAARQRDRVLAALRDAQDALLLARSHAGGAAAALRAARDALEAAGA
jgi:hypothetical protein